MTETEFPIPGERVRDGRTAGGAAWRAGVVLVVSVVALAAGGWAGSKVIQYDGRLVTGAAAPVAFGLTILVGLWLRASNVFAVGSMIGSIAGVQGLAWLVHDGYIADGRLHLSSTPGAVLEESMAAAGIAAVLVTVVWAAISGYRRPRQD
jgi:hypothetical protein